MISRKFDKYIKDKKEKNIYKKLKIIKKINLPNNQMSFSASKRN